MVTIEFPVDTNDSVYVYKRVLPISEIDGYDAEIPLFLPGRVVSVRKSGTRKYMKIAVKANWLKYCRDEDERGIPIWYRSGCGDCEKNFTFACGAIGETVFYTQEEAEEAAKRKGFHRVEESHERFNKRFKGKALRSPLDVECDKKASGLLDDPEMPEFEF